MAVWKFKTCPRCGGDVYLDRDIYSWYEQCVQCGHISDLRNISEFRRSATDNEREKAITGGERRGRGRRHNRREH